MGYSFAAGTTDGPGAFSFQQGTVTGNQLWNLIRNFLAKPSEEDVECHKPKPILLATGHVSYYFRLIVKYSEGVFSVPGRQMDDPG